MCSLFVSMKMLSCLAVNLKRFLEYSPPISPHRGSHKEIVPSRPAQKNLTISGTVELRSWLTVPLPCLFKLASVLVLQ